MKQSVSTVKENWQRLEVVLGYTFQESELLAEAMTHRSYANEFHAEELPDNERLEFLGDAVLDLIISQHLMASLPASSEGELTRMRAEVVSLPGLARLERQPDLATKWAQVIGAVRIGDQVFHRHRIAWILVALVRAYERMRAREEQGEIPSGNAGVIDRVRISTGGSSGTT